MFARCAFVLLVTLLTLGTSVVQPASAVRVSSGVRVINCSVTANQPHYSKGARGVIAKVRYSCTGNTAGTLTIDAYLVRYSAGQVGPYVPTARNVGVRRAVGPGSTGTVYVPAAGVPGIACNESRWYYAWARATLRAEGQTKVGSPRSAAVHPTCP